MNNKRIFVMVLCALMAGLTIATPVLGAPIACPVDGVVTPHLSGWIVNVENVRSHTIVQAATDANGYWMIEWSGQADGCQDKDTFIASYLDKKTTVQLLAPIWYAQGANLDLTGYPIPEQPPVIIPPEECPTCPDCITCPDCAVQSYRPEIVFSILAITALAFGAYRGYFRFQIRERYLNRYGNYAYRWKTVIQKTSTGTKIEEAKASG